MNISALFDKVQNIFMLHLCMHSPLEITKLVIKHTISDQEQQLEAQIA